MYSLCKGIIAEDVLNMGKYLEIQIHQANRTSYYLDAKRTSPKHIIMKPSEICNKEIDLKSAKG